MGNAKADIGWCPECKDFSEEEVVEYLDTFYREVTYDKFGKCRWCGADLLFDDSVLQPHKEYKLDGKYPKDTLHQCGGCGDLTENEGDCKECLEAEAQRAEQGL